MNGGSYLQSQIEIAIREREKERENPKPFEPDWLSPHPLCSLLDIVDEDPCKFIETIHKKFREEYLGNKNYRLISVYTSLLDLIEGSEIVKEALSKISYGSKEFWNYRYKDYWGKRKQSVTK